MPLPAPFLILALALLLLRSVHAQCFWPDGTPSSQYTVCDRDSTDTYSSCCAPDDLCTTNGLCKNALDDRDNNFYWRTTCSDPLWQSPHCPKHCTTPDRAPGSPRNNSHMVWACSQTTYCCSPWPWPGAGIPTRKSRYDCCDDAAAVFDAGPADFLSGRRFSTSLFPVTMTTASLGTPSPLTMSTTTSAASISPSAASSAAGPGGLGGGTVAGIGAGAAMGVVLLVAAGVWWMKRLGALREAGVGPKRQYATLAGAEPQVLVDTTELPAWSNNAGHVSEADSNGLHELEPLRTQMPAELAAREAVRRKEGH